MISFPLSMPRSLLQDGLLFSERTTAHKLLFIVPSTAKPHF
jgi:hypothetical protein